MSVEDGAAQVLSKVGLWWPSADEDQLRAAAAAWEHLTGALDAASSAGRGGVNQAVASWQGSAAEGFAQGWVRQERSLSDDAAGCRQLAAALNRYADAVADAKRRVEELAVTIGATIVVGTALAFFTFGAAEAAAAGISASLVAAAAAIGVELSTTVAAIAGGALAGVAFGAAEGVAVDAMVAQPLRVEAFHDGGYSPGEVATSAMGGGVTGGALGGVLGRVAAAPIAKTAAGDLSGLRAPGGQIRGALDPANWGPQGSSARQGVHEVPQQHTFKPHERETAGLLANEGKSVHARGEIQADGAKNPDALVRSGPNDPGTYTEFKAPVKHTTTAVKNEIIKAGEQLKPYGGGQAIIDGRSVDLSEEVAESALRRSLGQAKAHGQSLPDSIRIVLGDGTSIYHP